MFRIRFKVRICLFFNLILFTLVGCSQRTISSPNFVASPQIDTQTETVIPEATLPFTPTITLLPTITPSVTPTQRPTPLDYVLPPLSGKIAFVSTVDIDEFGAQDHIHIVDVAETDDILRLTTEGRFNFDPAWSPSGDEIAFSSNRGLHESGNFDIYVKSVINGSLRRLTTDIGTLEFHPTWSPDGNSIAFTMSGHEGSGSMDIFIMDHTGQNQYPITDTILPESYPAWSPVDDVIAFLYQDDPEDTRHTKDYYVYVMNADGSDRRKISDFPAVGPISWSPNGLRLAFTVVRGLADDIFVINADGSEGFFLTSDPNRYDYFPSWSPDGMYLAYYSYYPILSPDGTYSHYSGDTSITISDLYGTIVKKIAIVPEFGWPLWYLAWSP